MTSSDIRSTVRLLVVAAALAVCSCKSGPTATDYLDDARRAMEASRLDEAKTYVDMAEEKGARSRSAAVTYADIERKLAERALEREEFEKAFRHYTEAGDRDPRRKKQAAAYIRAVEVGQKGGLSADKLAPIARRAVDANPSSARAHRLNGQLWDEAGEADKAIRSYLWLWQADHSRADVGRRLAALYRQVGRLGDAAAILRQLIEAQSESAQATLNLAQIYAEMGDIERARALFEQLIADHPDKPGILLRYARFLAGRGETERARELKKKAYEQMPGVDKRKMRELQ